SRPPFGPLAPPKTAIPRDAVVVGPGWGVRGDARTHEDETSRVGIADLKRFLHESFGLTPEENGKTQRFVTFRITGTGQPPSLWNTTFRLSVDANGIRVSASSGHGVLRACLYLSNLWRLRRCPWLAPGTRHVCPAVLLHIGADLWGGVYHAGMDTRTRRRRKFSRVGADGDKRHAYYGVV
ncbi:MAG: hypothetical protein FJY97_19460, partial [candidate division Zixibacteria bacterium]|nr:hypothetical protein [candidate division Zixibacteria bacterium]